MGIKQVILLLSLFSIGYSQFLSSDFIKSPLCTKAVRRRNFAVHVFVVKNKTEEYSPGCNVTLNKHRASVHGGGLKIKVTSNDCFKDFKNVSENIVNNTVSALFTTNRYPSLVYLHNSVSKFTSPSKLCNVRVTIICDSFVRPTIPPTNETEDDFNFTNTAPTNVKLSDMNWRTSTESNIKTRLKVNTYGNCIESFYVSFSVFEFCKADEKTNGHMDVFGTRPTVTEYNMPQPNDKCSVVE
ncbi:chemokine binding protein [Pteropox virus]|uniref:Chemokine binding protein n=1 Tax=Pteropox virus TaxID=1873698 RepID=A0A1B1MRK2_9POXV|nr:chemokine binding protein [Pteropox virus]ANS71218.1 chemokine binding protein [Pteropox virus]